MDLTRNPSGVVGAILRLTAQSIKVAVPRIAKTIVFMWSIGTDLITIALAPVRQSASTWVRRSAPLGFSYTRPEYSAAKHRRGYVDMYLQGR